MLIRPFFMAGPEACKFLLSGMGALVIHNFCPDVVPVLLEAAEGLKYVERPAEFGPRKVKQDLATAELKPGTVLWDAADELEWRLGRHFGPKAFESPLQFTSRAVQRYPHKSIGIGRHRDRSNIRNLIVLLGIKGESRFRVYEGLDGPPRISLSFGEGDLLLIVAPGYAYAERDVRPYHGVDMIDGDPYRYILALRQVVEIEGVSNDYN